jgi:hypothetical protein
MRLLYSAFAAREAYAISMARRQSAFMSAIGGTAGTVHPGLSGVVSKSSLELR